MRPKKSIWKIKFAHCIEADMIYLQVIVYEIDMCMTLKNRDNLDETIFGYFPNHLIRITSSNCNFGMHISFGSPPESEDDIHIQSYLESFDCKKK